jgi:hypothetical protein
MHGAAATRLTLDLAPRPQLLEIECGGRQIAGAGSVI